MDVILTGMGLIPVKQFITIHNYINIDNMILRKGAVAAYAGQNLLIPINMRDGSLICAGKLNFNDPKEKGLLQNECPATDSFLLFA